MRRTRLGVGVVLVSVLAVASCRDEPGAVESFASNEAHIASGIARVPTGDAVRGNVAVDGSSTNLYANVDDGTSFIAADDGATTIRNHWGTLVSNYTAGYSGFPAGTVSEAAVYYRARADSGVTGTIQVRLYDGAVLIGSGPVRSLSSAYTNYTETFSGLSASDANNLRTEVLLNVPGGTGYVRCTQVWLEAGLGASDAGSPSDTGAPPIDAGSCSTNAASSLVPTSDVSKGNVTVDGDSSAFFRNVDDGVDFAAADDGATDIRNRWADSSSNYTAGFSGSATGISRVVANFRAEADNGIGGTAQIKLFDGTTLIGTGAPHALGSAWANFSDVFTGLPSVSASNLRAQVLLQRTASTGYMRVTELWLEASADACVPCTPTTCAAQGKNCGSIPDGCGGTLTCGSCPSPQTCGGGGTPNLCGGGSPPTGDPILVGAGDISICGSANGEPTATILDALFANGANANGVVFTAGDNAYNDGLLSEYQNCYHPTWGRHKARTRPSPGNHERDVTAAGGYFQYYGSNAGDPSRGAYYSYELGTWHVVVLDSYGASVSAGSAQEQWLRADLASHPGKCTVAYFHAPRFNSGSSHGSQSFMQPVWQALYDYDADVVISGHEHIYERFAPQTPTGVADPVRGIRQFTVGTGGATLYSYGSAVANSEVRYNGSYGVLKLTLHDGSFDWEFVSAEGSTFTDKGTGTCHVP
jgi:hypothetical protein